MTDQMMDLEAMFGEAQSGATTPQVPTPPAPPAPPQVQTQTQTQATVTPEPVVPQAPAASQVNVPASPQVPVQNSNHSVLSSSATPSSIQSNNIVRSKVADNFEIDVPDSVKSSLLEVGADIGDIGMKVSRIPIEKYKASASKIDRIGFVWSKVTPIKYHYIEGKGSVMCFHGKCCELQGNPTVRYLFPIAVYQTDSEGNVSGGKVSLMILSAGEELYRTIQTLHKGSMAYGGISHVDLLVTCTDEKYQKLSLVQAGPAIWREYQAIADFLQDKMRKDFDKAYMAVARHVDESSFLKMIDMGAEEPPAPQYDSVSNQDLSKFFG